MAQIVLYQMNLRVTEMDGKKIGRIEDEKKVSGVKIILFTPPFLIKSPAPTLVA